jgi:hypothetical protein
VAKPRGDQYSMKDKADHSLETRRAPTNRHEGLKLGAASLMMHRCGYLH